MRGDVARERDMLDDNLARVQRHLRYVVAQLAERDKRVEELEEALRREVRHRLHEYQGWTGEYEYVVEREIAAVLESLRSIARATLEDTSDES